MFQPVIKWSGSKRTQSEKIKSFLPNHFNTYYEPFIGGGSMLYSITPEKAICGDICVPLIALWNEIKTNPNDLAESYRVRWERLQKDSKVYYEIRDNYNKNNNPQDLLFLSRTCINGLIRFNANGVFNSSFHYKRPGISPDTLKSIILDWSKHISGANFIAEDYRVTTVDAKEGDIVYIDPPYFHTRGMYYGTIDYDELFMFLEDINHRGVKYILSLDLKRGYNDKTIDIPSELYKRHEFIKSGLSSFSRIVSQKSVCVFESIYLNW